MKKVLSIIIILLVLTSLFFVFGLYSQKQSEEGLYKIPENLQAECDAQGGEIIDSSFMSLTPNYVCAVPYNDGDMECTYSDQCEGKCFAYKHFDPNTKESSYSLNKEGYIIGQCQKDSRDYPLRRGGGCQPDGSFLLIQPTTPDNPQNPIPPRLCV